MRRFDYGGCDECSFGKLEESPEGDWMDADEVQARDLKLAELAKALPHDSECAALWCAVCNYEEPATTHYCGSHHQFTAKPCNCPRGELLAMLRETK